MEHLLVSAELKTLYLASNFQTEDESVDILTEIGELANQRAEGALHCSHSKCLWNIYYKLNIYISFVIFVSTRF